MTPYVLLLIAIFGVVVVFLFVAIVIVLILAARGLAEEVQRFPAE